MLTQKQQETLNQYVDLIHELLLDQVRGLREGEHRQLRTKRRMYARMFGQILYEAPSVFTGYASVKLVEQKLADFSTKVSVEHHHSRQRGGEALIALVDKAVASGVDFTREQVWAIVYKYCQVHYTTPEENTALIKQQRKCLSEGAYRRSRVSLIEARDLFTYKGGRSAAWMQSMRDKYLPIIKAMKAPPEELAEVPSPLVIN